MPNIEIHGFDEIQAVMVKQRVFKLFEDRPYVDVMVVTIFPSIVTDKTGKNQPYLRFVHSPLVSKKEAEEIKTRLQELDIDLEDLPIADFIPRKSYIPKKKQ